jgi:uncharacterized protein YdeI (YjbR/CyaY-like superfamily)
MNDARKLDGKPVRNFAHKSAWATWLRNNHAKSSGVWVRIAKKASELKSISRDDPLDVALCYGWIDGQARSEGEATWLQKFTPRGKRSIWSKINREKVAALIRSGHRRDRRAKAFFDTLNSQNRYAILFRLQTAKRPETRARRLEQFVAMLSRREKLHG